MKVILFGATGMVGQGVLRECLLDPEVNEIVSVVRTGSGKIDSKLHEIVHRDFLDYSGLGSAFAGADACFYCLGVSSFRMEESRYREITYGYALAAANTLAKLNPGMAFIYVSGTGADSTEKGSTMWARVRGATENALLELPLRVTIMRPAGIVPLGGIQSRTAIYRLFYTALTPVLPAIHRLFPKYVTTTEQIGRSMLRIARHGAPKPVLESRDLNLV